jgi:hypothetical protein
MEVRLLLSILIIINVAWGILVGLALRQQDRRLTWLQAQVEIIKEAQKSVTILMVSSLGDGPGGQVLWDVPATVGEKGGSVNYSNGTGMMKMLLEQGALPAELAGGDVRLCIYRLGKAQ